MADATLNYTCDQINEAVGKGLKLPDNISDACGCFLKITDDGGDISISAPVEIIAGRETLVIPSGERSCLWSWENIPFKEPSSSNQNNVFGVIQIQNVDQAMISKEYSGYLLTLMYEVSGQTNISFEYILFKDH